MICHMAFSLLCFITIVFSLKKKKAKTQADIIFTITIDFTHFSPSFLYSHDILKTFSEGQISILLELKVPQSGIGKLSLLILVIFRSLVDLAET